MDWVLGGGRRAEAAASGMDGGRGFGLGLELGGSLAVSGSSWSCVCLLTLAVVFARTCTFFLKHVILIFFPNIIKVDVTNAYCVYYGCQVA